jgi:catechol 2,3-dioxygenase-like lactoylglutathione lyase family enzyme
MAEHHSGTRSLISAIEKISGVTFRVVNMAESVRFYKDVLAMELLYGGESTRFSSLRARDAQSAILHLEWGEAVTHWGRLIFYVTDVDALWNHLKDRGFDPEIRRDAAWGERYFRISDPDGHELSFVRPRQRLGEKYRCKREPTRASGGLSRYTADSRERHSGSVITAHPVHAAPGRS